MACLTLSVPSLYAKGEGEEVIAQEASEKYSEFDVDDPMRDNDNCGEKSMQLIGSKRDPSLRRHELLAESGLAENCGLVRTFGTCIFKQVNRMLEQPLLLLPKSQPFLLLGTAADRRLPSASSLSSEAELASSATAKLSAAVNSRAL